MPAVSVLLPVRDARPFLAACVAGLCRQSLTDFEIVAVDDHSTDGSRAFLEKQARTNTRIRVLGSAGHGIVAALETARRVSRAPILARCDADDIPHRERLREQLALVDHGGASMVVGCGVRFFPRSSVGRGLRLYEEWLNAACTPEEIDRELFVENPLPHPTLMVSSDLIDRVGGWRATAWPEDYDLVLRLAQAGSRFTKLPAPRMAIREHSNRLTWTDPRYGREAFIACKAHYLARGPLREARPFVIWGAGRTGKRLGRALACDGFRPAFFVDIDPAKIGGRVQGRPVVAPERLRTGRDALILGAVSSRGARGLIRARLTVDLGCVEGDDFLMCA